MNKQFDKLMYDAGMTAQGCWDELDSYQRGAIEKFAELIVKECVETISSHMSRHVTGAVRNNGFNLGLATARESIEEHFGVEE